MVICKRTSPEAMVAELKAFMQANQLQKLSICVTDNTMQKFFEIKSVGMVFIN